MKVTNYDNFTGVPTSVGVATDNPVNPDMPLIPAYATVQDAPSVQAGQVAIYVDPHGVPPMNWEFGEWKIVPDYRAIPLYSVPSGEPYEIGGQYAGVGPLPAMVTDQPRPSPAHGWRDGAWVLDEGLAATLRVDAARIKRQAESARARTAIEPLQMAVELGIQTEAEGAALIEWRRYFVALSRIDVTAATIEWPEAPVT